MVDISMWNQHRNLNNYFYIWISRQWFNCNNIDIWTFMISLQNTKQKSRFNIFETGWPQPICTDKNNDLFCYVHSDIRSWWLVVEWWILLQSFSHKHYYNSYHPLVTTWLNATLVIKWSCVPPLLSRTIWNIWKALSMTLDVYDFGCCLLLVFVFKI